MKKTSNPISLYSVIFIAIVVSFLKFNYHQKNIFAFDNYGYYLYLPAAFIQHDLAFSNIDTFNKLNDQYNNTPTLYQLMQVADGKVIIRMYMGIALLLSPAFFVGHGVALLTGMPADGFSPPYQAAVIIYGLLLTLAGLFVARKLLLNFFSDKITAISLLVTYLATNLFFFAGLGNPMPHVYLFNLYIFLLWFTVSWHKNPKWRYSTGIGLMLGLIIAIRPSDIIVVLIPVLYAINDTNSLKEKTALLLNHYKQIVWVAFLVFLFIVPQIIYWRIIAGEYLVSVYNDPSSRMEWGNPRILNTLFSFRKGWFIYSPISLLAIAGIFISFKNHRNLFLFSIVFIVLNLYMISCFSSLISYGYRAFIQSYAILLLSMAVFIEYISKQRIWIIYLALSLLPVFVYLNVVQAKQLLLDTIDGSRMTKEAYLSVLGKFNAERPEDKMLVQRSGYSIDTLSRTEQYSVKHLMYYDFEKNIKEYGSNIDSAIRYQGNHSFRMDSTNVFSPGIKIKLKNLDYSDHFWIRASVMFYSNDSSQVTQGNLVVTVVYNDKPVKYRAINLDMLKTPIKIRDWNVIEFDYISPEFIPDDAELQIYFWNNGKSTIWIDDLKADIYKPAEE